MNTVYNLSSNLTLRNLLALKVCVMGAVPVQAEAMLYRMKQMVTMPTLKPDRSAYHSVLEGFAYFSREWNGHGLQMLEFMGGLRQDRIEVNKQTPTL